MENETVPAEDSKQATDTTPQVETEVETEETTEEVEETPEELRDRLEKAEKKAFDQEQRAIKAEKRANQKPPTTAEQLNSKDLVAIMNAKVPEDDIDEVVEYAKYKKVSISEVLKDPIMKSTLDLRAEERNTAASANTSSARRGSNRIPDDVLLSNANRGKFAESDSEIERLMAAKLKVEKGGK